LTELHGAGRIFGYDAVQFLAPERGKRPTTAGPVQMFFVDKRSVFTAQVTEFDSA
jgi:hypothetical protein